MNEWGIPVSKDKIIARRNRLIEYQKVGELRFTPLYEIIDVNILDINYMLHEIDNLQSKIDKDNELIETYKNERDTYKRLTEAYIKKYKDSIRKLVLYETILGDKNETIDFYKARIKKAIKELNNRDYNDGDFESMRFQNNVINILEGNE